jgi:ribosomal subunit interface protein
VFKAEVLISGIPKHIRSVSEKEDLYAAIDDVRDEAERQLVGMKDRRDTIFRRGARSVKKMLKGLSKRNPFTSKVD